MRRKEALDFIRNNSRCASSVCINPVPKAERYDTYVPQYLEHRLGNNGTPFILHDCGENGWDLYFISGANEVKKTIDDFCKNTGVDLQTAKTTP